MKQHELKDGMKAPFVVLTLRLKELDLKCVPVQWDTMDSKTYETQLKLGKTLFEALVRWGTAPEEQANTLHAKMEQDARNLIVKHMTWIIDFIDACTHEKRSEIDLSMIRDGVELLLNRFRGMDAELDNCLTVMDESQEVFLLRKEVGS